jgi:DNA processing protein
VSQFAAGFAPLEYKFLARNVTIAALSQVLIVVQAPARSGSLNTAHIAAEMGREVFVVPANIDAPNFQGSFNLIRDGATLVYHPGQVLDVLGVQQNPQAIDGDISDLGKKIVGVLGLEPLDTDRIAERTGLSPGDVLSELTILELDGEVMRESGGYVLRK